jgi:hypothetical protein
MTLQMVLRPRRHVVFSQPPPPPEHRSTAYEMQSTIIRVRDAPAYACYHLPRIIKGFYVLMDIPYAAKAIFARACCSRGLLDLHANMLLKAFKSRLRAGTIIE